MRCRGPRGRCPEVDVLEDDDNVLQAMTHNMNIHPEGTVREVLEIEHLVHVIVDLVFIFENLVLVVEVSMSKTSRTVPSK